MNYYTIAEIAGRQLVFRQFVPFYPIFQTLNQKLYKSFLFFFFPCPLVARGWGLKPQIENAHRKPKKTLTGIVWFFISYHLI